MWSHNTKSIMNGSSNSASNSNDNTSIITTSISNSIVGGSQLMLTDAASTPPTPLQLPVVSSAFFPFTPSWDIFQVRINNTVSW